MKFHLVLPIAQASSEQQLKNQPSIVEVKTYMERELSAALNSRTTIYQLVQLIPYQPAAGTILGIDNGVVMIQNILEYDPSTLFVLIGLQESIHSQQSFVLLSSDLKSILQVSSTSDSLMMVPIESITTATHRPLARFTVHGPLDRCYLTFDGSSTCTVATVGRSLMCSMPYTRFNIQPL